MPEYSSNQEIERYRAASEEGNKFAVVFSGAPFLSIFAFASVSFGDTEWLTVWLICISAVCLFATLLYSLVRLVQLNRCRAVVLSNVALEIEFPIEIRRPLAWMSRKPAFALSLGVACILLAFFVDVSAMDNGVASG
ncbi:MAG: hypothetical protein AAGF88_06925 [Pseudomonadota bacterium]